MRRLTKIAVSTLLISALVVTPVMAEPQVDMDNLTFSEEDSAQIDSLQNQKALAQGEVEELTAQLTTLIEQIGELEVQLVAKGEEINSAQADLDAAEAKEEAQYAAMKLRIKFMYEGGDSTLITTVAAAESMSDALNKAEYATEISNYDRDMITEYVNTQNEIAALKEQLITEQDELLVMQDEMTAYQAELNELIAEKQDEVAEFEVLLQNAIEVATQNAIAAEQERLRREAEAAAAAAAAAAASAQEVEDAYVNAGGDPDEYDSSDYNTSSSSSYCGYDPGTGNAIVDAAYTQLGVPYVWGGSTPYVALDCSGLVQYCYACAGKSIPRTSAAMIATGTPVSDPQPGDICWTPGHVAIYIGGGQMIEAQQSGVPVKISSVRVSVYLRY